MDLLGSRKILNYEKFRVRHRKKHARTWWMTVMHRQGVQSGPFPTSAAVHKGIRIITAGSHYGQMRFHCLSLALSQKTEMLRVAELLRYILRFHFTFMAGAWGLKMCLPPLSIIQANTQRQIYNSTTGELIQFIGAGVFLFFFFPLSPSLSLSLSLSLFFFQSLSSSVLNPVAFTV